MADIKPEHRQWAKYLRDLIPGTMRVAAYADKTETNFIDIFTSESAEGVVAATVGLMDHDQSRNAEVQVFTEIVMDARGRQASLCNVLASIAFFIIKDGWTPAPGVVFETMLESYAPKLRVKHVMFTTPFQWPISRVALANKTIYPLLAVPITDEELELARDQGEDALTTIWEEAKTDVLDWTRSSAV